ncbi:uncharacterized protein LOC111268017 isoform X2 [Varroa jacobsoni]|uniref:Cyclin-like domain-containing protein n=1 Tax=Varroa destructor TaxID=109461 RepID=A0A7M7JL06_VARDE|nr:uncharacterized protein LOC111247038 isoform X2 [Varroa destructor]XP_022702428.1 uncharacterized protein LOC111268017 isoform X2 [Varroa jacobsoni]
MRSPDNFRDREIQESDMIGMAGFVLHSYKRPLTETDGQIIKKARMTIKDVCGQKDQNSECAVNNVSSPTTHPTLFMFTEQDIRDEHVVKICSELESIQETVSEVDVTSCDDAVLTNGDDVTSKLEDGSVSSLSSSDARSSASVNSLSGLRRDPEIDKALQQKRKPLYIDIHLSSPDSVMKDTVWDEDQYKVEIIANLLQRERNRIPLSCHSAYIEHREKILAWMLNAAKTLKLSIEVIQLAIYFYDRFVDHANRLFLGDKLEMQVLTCLQLAAKSIEWDHHIPRGSDLNALLVCPYELSEYVRAERQMLLFFQWNVSVPVLSTFLGFFREYLLENVKHPQTRKSLRDLAEYFEKATLYHIILQSLPCSLLAVAVVVACRTLMEVQPFFPVSLRAILPDEEHQQMYWAGFLISSIERDRTGEGFKLRSQFGLPSQRPSLSRLSSRALPSSAANLKLRSNSNQPTHGVHSIARCYLPINPPPINYAFSSSITLSNYRPARNRKKPVALISHDISTRPYSSNMALVKSYRRNKQFAQPAVSAPPVSSLSSRTVQERF